VPLFILIVPIGSRANSLLGPLPIWVMIPFLPSFSDGF